MRADAAPGAAERRFVSVPDPLGARQWHLRAAGAGPALLLLHASPLCSRSLLALGEALSGSVTAVAVDTPGYGFSDPLRSPARDIGGYAAALAALLDALALRSAGIYGTATGAQIAIEFAKRFPERTDYLVLDNAASFTDSEREAIVSGYFPDLAPRADGGHCVQAWRMMRDVFRFFPWHDARAASRVGGGATPAAAHAGTLACLRAGADYRLAYRLAFDNERAERIEPIRRPTRIALSEGGILRRYAERLAARRWPGPVRVARCAAGPKARFAAVAEAVAELSAGQPAADLPAAERPRALRAPAGARPASAYVPVDGGLCRALVAGDPDAPAALLLHDAGDEAGALRKRLSELAARRWALAVDLPGHGLSDGAERWSDTDGPGAWLSGVLDALEIERCALAGRGVGAELAALCADAARALCPALLPGASPSLPEPGRWPDLEPRASGAHWLEAWHMLEERHWRGPLVEAPAPAALTREALALFDSAAGAALGWLGAR